MRMKKAAVGLLWGCLFLAGCRSEFISGMAPAEETAIVDLQVEYRDNPIGIEEEAPLFSWKMDSSVRGQKQTAYRLMVAKSPEELEKEELVWDSKQQESAVSAAVCYEGEALEAATRYYWTVQVWDKDGRMINGSQEAFFETGLKNSGWSGAEWISAPDRVMETAFDAEACIYTISYDAQAQEGTAAGFIFGADTDAYGEYYVWTLTGQGEEAVLKTAYRVNYQDQEEEITILSGILTAADLAAGKAHVEIRVKDTEAITWINGQQAAVTQLYRAKPAGRIGVFNTRSEKEAYMDNILVVDGEGAVLYQEDFSDGDTIFSPEYIKISEQRGYLQAGTRLVPGDDGPAPILRREFELQKKEIASARLYASALGVYELFVNGQAVTDAFFEPGQTVYDKELTYCTYDVTALLQQGKNAMGAVLGHGWFDRAAGYENAWAAWGSVPAFLGKLVICYEDGSQEILVTDESWQVYTEGPIRRNDMYQGEFYDARYEVTGFSTAGFQAQEGWEEPIVGGIEEKFQKLPIAAFDREPIVQAYTMEPAAVTQLQEDVFVYDFGQEFSGVCRIKVKGQEGQCITLRYAEAVNTEALRNKDDQPGTVWTRNLLSAANTDYYICKGSESESYTPHFVYRGFRYVQISGVTAAQLESVEGLVLMSGIKETGAFACSDAFLNRLYHNTFWSLRSNFMDTPIDCPQRDERFGWTGDIGQFAKTAVYHTNSRNFLKNYLEGMRLEQKENGAYPDMVPHTDKQGYGNNGWADAAVLITWALYRQYADLSVVEDNFEAMCAWVDYLEEHSEQYIRRCDDSFGDHLEGSGTSKELTDTAQSAYSALLLSEMAKALGEQQKADHYLEVYERFKTAWQQEWLLEDGMIVDGTQGAYTLALDCGLYPKELTKAGQDWLALCVEWVDAHPKTGFVTTSRILQKLAESGRSDLAYRMLLQKTAPSWNHDIMLGATTIAESWSSYVPFEDGTYELHGSLNHFALGSVGEWFYSGILGIQTAEDVPGFQKLLLNPQICEQISWAQGSYESIYGTIMVKWEYTENGYRYTVTVPANTSATLILPIQSGQRVFEGENELSAESESENIKLLGAENDRIMLELDAGSYDFGVK